MFVKVNDKLVNVRHIRLVDCHDLESLVSVNVHYFYEPRPDVVTGQPAIDLIMQLNPSILEGRRLKFIRHSWAIHNLVAHPALQILAWFKLTKLGMRIHDRTVPKPRT